MKDKTKLRIVQILCIVSLLITVFSIQRTYARYFEKVDTTYATHIKKWVINVNEKDIHNEQTLNSVMTPVIVEDENVTDNVLVPGRIGYFPFEIDYSNVDLSFQLEFQFEQLNKAIVIDEDTGEETQVDAHLEDFEIYGYSIIKGEKKVTVESTDIATFKPIMNIQLVGFDEDTNQYIHTYSMADSNISTEDLEEFNTAFEQADANKKVEVQVLFRWNDANIDTEDEIDADGMNNFEDTQFTGEINAEAEEGDLNKLLRYNVGIKFTQYVGQIGS